MEIVGFDIFRLTLRELNEDLITVPTPVIPFANTGCSLCILGP